MQNVIIGTAGHIDHGKTTLIKALTGRSTDKLKEEIKRGISINLGFTYFDLPSGRRAGIVDVPGHERFIKNMLAGATGIDIVLLVIAANEGIKPQTIEHMDILSYLDIKDSIIVLTKCGLADEVMMELVIDDINESFKGTFFEGAEIIPVDSHTMTGIDKLISKVDEIAAAVKTKNERASSRLHIDRVFSMKGFGTIVTGTLAEGVIAVGDELEIYPKMMKAKIRSVQVHDQSVEKAFAGQRTALNISNVRREDIERGDVLATPGTMNNTLFLDVRITVVSHTDWTIKLWDRVRVYLGASEVLARVVPLDKDKIEKGETAYCQLRLEKELACKKNDKFVLRTFSPLVTIGGGIIIDPNPKKHGKGDKLSLETLKIRDTSDTDTLVEEYIRKSGEEYVSVKNISSYISVDETAATDILKRLIERKAVFEIGKAILHGDTVEGFTRACIERLSVYHNKFPLRKGMLKEELKTKTTTLKLKEFDILLKMLEGEDVIKIIDNSFIALKNFEIVYSKEQTAIKNEIEKVLKETGFSPPSIESITKGMAKESMEVFESLAGVTIIKLDPQTAIYKGHYEKAKELLLDFMKNHKEITLGEFRDLIDSSRKYAVLLLDDFDRNGITLRVGDSRVLRNRSN